jgi:hypothetical protein
MVELTPEQIARNAHIPTEEIEQDIADTKREIYKMNREMDAFKILAEEGDRMADMRYRARRSGIEERLAFIAKLEAILAVRSTAAEEQSGGKL